MKTTLLYVTHAKDFRWLNYSLRSLAKFGRGFHEVKIVVPERDIADLNAFVKEFVLPFNPFPIVTACEKEWDGKGMLWHMAQIVYADIWCPEADMICHFDPDCIFDAPVSPETFLKNGKPILRYEGYESLCARHPAHRRWQEAAERCLPFAVPWETMRGHPECYLRKTYAQTRERIREKTGMAATDYIRSCENSFPQTFAEFPVLGAVALHDSIESYSPWDCGKQSNPDYQPYPVIQFWSHSAPDQPQDFWLKGRQVREVPLRILEKLLFT